VSYLTQAYYASKLALKAKGPTIMVVSGVVSMGAAAIVGGKKTLHLEEVLTPHTETLSEVERVSGEMPKEYTPEKARADRVKIACQAGWDVTKLYAVPTVLFVGGAALVFGGHHIMLKRNATLAIAFTSISEAFAAYRERVIDNFGSETDQAMAHGWVTREIVDDKTGHVEVIHTRDWEAESDPYNRVFQQGESSQWVNDLGVNKMFVSSQQRFAQELLARRGHLYLSEVYEALGFPESDISRVVGWKVIRKPDGSKSIPNVDFGLDKPHPDDWKYDRENGIYLDFNCQGLIVGGKVQKLLEKA
jgi:hypothetical protein